MCLAVVVNTVRIGIVEPYAKTPEILSGGGAGARCKLTAPATDLGQKEQ